MIIHNPQIQNPIITPQKESFHYFSIEIILLKPVRRETCQRDIKQK